MKMVAFLLCVQESFDRLILLTMPRSIAQEPFKRTGTPLPPYGNVHSDTTTSMIDHATVERYSDPSDAKSVLALPPRMAQAGISTLSVFCPFSEVHLVAMYNINEAQIQS